MSGQLYMLTPVTSPMVTRPASPDSAAGGLGLPPSALGHTPHSAFLMPASFGASMEQTSQPAAHKSSSLQVAGPPPATVAPSAVVPTVLTEGDSSSTAGQPSTTPADTAQSPWALVPSAVGSAISKVKSGSGSPHAQQADSQSSNSSSPRGLAALLPEVQQQQCRWKPHFCCSSCGAARADGGCSSCFCKVCVAPGAAAGAGRSGLGGPCSNCHSLCSSCKPIPCSFCDERSDDSLVYHTNSSSSSIRPSSSVNRMCDACAGTCDSCKRPACAACAATFVSCSSCGYASCEECRLQAHMTAGGAAAANGGVSGACWCAPPLRTASNVRHVTSQRYQMSQLHPSVLACSMEAVGLRDADLDDYDAYDDYDSMGEVYDTHDHQLSSNSECSDLVSQYEQHQHGLGSYHGTQLGSRALAALFESLGGHPSPASSYSSSGHVMAGSFGGYGSPATAIAAAMAAGEVGSSGSVGYWQRHQGGAAAGRLGGVRGLASREGLVR